MKREIKEFIEDLELRVRTLERSIKFAEEANDTGWASYLCGMKASHESTLIVLKGL